MWMYVRRHGTPGRDPLAREGGEHAGQLRVPALGQPGHVAQRNAGEHALEQPVPVRMGVKVRRAVRPEGGGDQAGVVGPQRVVHERQGGVAEVEEAQPAQHTALLRGVAVPVQVADLVREGRAAQRQTRQQENACGVVDRPAVRAPLRVEEGAPAVSPGRGEQPADGAGVGGDLLGCRVQPPRAGAGQVREQDRT
jgi:hypothetical protein